MSGLQVGISILILFFEVFILNPRELRIFFVSFIEIEIPIKEIKSVKLEVREGFNPRRRVSLRIKGKKDLPISRVGSPKPLLELENEGAEIARFLEVNLEGI